MSLQSDTTQSLKKSCPSNYLLKCVLDAKYYTVEHLNFQTLHTATCLPVIGYFANLFAAELHKHKLCSDETVN